MKRILTLAALSFMVFSPAARAEFLQIDLSIFGMD